MTTRERAYQRLLALALGWLPKDIILRRHIARAALEDIDPSAVYEDLLIELDEAAGLAHANSEGLGEQNA